MCWFYIWSGVQSWYFIDTEEWGWISCYILVGSGENCSQRIASLTVGAWIFLGRKGFFLEDYDKDLSEANPIFIADNMHFKSFESNNLAHWACVISLRCRLGCHDIAGRCLYSYNMNDGSNVVKTIVSHQHMGGFFPKLTTRHSILDGSTHSHKSNHNARKGSSGPKWETWCSLQRSVNRELLWWIETYGQPQLGELTSINPNYFASKTRALVFCLIWFWFWLASLFVFIDLPRNELLQKRVTICLRHFKKCCRFLVGAWSGSMSDIFRVSNPTIDRREVLFWYFLKSFWGKWIH